MYPIFGNHEPYPANMYSFEPEGAEREFNSIFADIWEDWIGKGPAD